jgi:hypothetical protein
MAPSIGGAEFKKIRTKWALHIDQPKEYPGIPASITINRKTDEALRPVKRG